MDNLVEASATSLANPEATSHVASTLAYGLVSETAPISCFLILAAFLQVSFAEPPPPTPTTKMSLMAVSAARIRARAAAAMEQADNAWGAGGWFSAVYDEDDSLVPEAVRGPGQVRCLQVEEEGRMVWVCV